MGVSTFCHGVAKRGWWIENENNSHEEQISSDEGEKKLCDFTGFYFCHFRAFLQKLSEIFPEIKSQKIYDKYW